MSVPDVTIAYDDGHTLTHMLHANSIRMEGGALHFLATDDHGNSCSGVLEVSVGKSQGRRQPVDEGALYDSTIDVFKP